MKFRIVWTPQNKTITMMIWKNLMTSHRKKRQINF